MAKRKSRSDAHDTNPSPAAHTGETPAEPAKTTRARASRAASSRRAVATKASAGVPGEETFAARAGVDQPPMDASSSSARASAMASEPSEEQIRERAYQRYLERGARHGRHFEDWLEAERELRGHQ
jgi:hypothetical protein